MHRRLAELVEYTQLQRQEILAAVTEVPDEVRGRRADDSTWSVAEVLEHLHRVETGIARLIGRGIQRAKAAGAQAERDDSSLLGSLDSYRLVSGRPAMPAPELVMPRGELTAAQALAGLELSRRDLLSAASEGDGLALEAITYPHPLLGALNLYQWILFVGQHEARHAGQIRDIAARFRDGRNE
jgi:DinB superfamily